MPGKLCVNKPTAKTDVTSPEITNATITSCFLPVNKVEEY